MDFSKVAACPAESTSAEDTYFLLGEDCLVVRKYTVSRLDHGSLSVAQDRMPDGGIVFYFEEPYYGNLALFTGSEDDDPGVPSHIRVTIGHDEYEPAFNHGYLLIGGPFEAGCRITLTGMPARAVSDEAVKTDETAKGDGSAENDKDAENGESAEGDEYIENDEAAESDETVETDEAAGNDKVAESDGSNESDETTGNGESAENDETAETAASTDIPDGSFVAPDADAETAEEAAAGSVSGISAVGSGISDIAKAGTSAADVVSTGISAVAAAGITTVVAAGISAITASEKTDTADTEVSAANTSEISVTADTAISAADTSEKTDTDAAEVAAATASETPVAAAAEKTIGNTAVSSFSSTFREARIFFSERKQRYLLKISDGNGAHAILPDGTEIFAKAGAHAFTGYRMRTGDREYDLVVMRENCLTDKAKSCNAYMNTLGSFLQDCCYCVDTSHPEKNGTHGVHSGSDNIDIETGYKWGAVSSDTYEFELENGFYNVNTIIRQPDGSLKSDREIRKINRGMLSLCCGRGAFTHISITAADNVISEYSSYSELARGEKVLAAAYLFDPSYAASVETSVESTAATASDSTKEGFSSVRTETDMHNSNTAPAPAVSKPQFEHISGSAPGAFAGIEKNAGNVGEFVFAPLTGSSPDLPSDEAKPEEPVSDVSPDTNDTEHETLCAGSTEETEGNSRPDAKAEEMKGDARCAANSNETENDARPAACTNEIMGDARRAACANETVGDARRAASVEGIEKNTGEGSETNESPRIRISTYTAPPAAPAIDVSRHITGKLQTRKVKNAATAAGIAAGAAVLGGIIKALTGRRR